MGTLVNLSELAESNFIPLNGGVPLGVLCILKDKSGLFLCSDYGIGISSQQTGSNQQRVFLDKFGPSAIWRLKPEHSKKQWLSESLKIENNEFPPIRLEHALTLRNLHSHDTEAYNEDFGFEVTGFGNFGRGDENDNWRLSLNNEKFTLTHVRQNAVLCSKSAEEKTVEQSELYTILAEDLQQHSNEWNNIWDIRFLPIESNEGYVKSSQVSGTPILTSGDDVFISKGAIPELNIEFDNAYSVQTFFEEEQKKWSFVNISGVEEQRDSVCRSIIQQIQNFHINFATQSDLLIRKNITEFLVNEFKNQRWTWSWLPFGAFILAETENTTTKSFSIGLYLELFDSLSPRDQNQVGNFINARFLIERYKNAKLHPKIIEVSEGSEVKEKIDTFSKTLNSYENLLHESTSSIRSRSIQIVQQFDSLIKQGKSDLSGLTLQFQTAIKNSSIETDLDKKRKSHRNYFWGFLSLAILIGISSFWWILCVSMPVIRSSLELQEQKKLSAIVHASNTEVAHAIQETIGHSAWFDYLTLGILITMALYVIRLLVRLSMSQFHQMQDAEERLVLLRTFYTLLDLLKKHDQQFTESERKSIISLIYRPGMVGVVKDEYGSLSLWDNLSRLLMK